MLQTHVSFAGPTVKLLNYLGNCKAIQAPTITRTAPGPGQYTVTFLTARKIDASKIASSVISVQCQSPSGTLTFTNVIPSPVAVFNANANSGYNYQVSFKIEVQGGILVTLLGIVLIELVGFVDRPAVMLSIVAKNNYDVEEIEYNPTPSQEANFKLPGITGITNPEEPPPVGYLSERDMQRIKDTNQRLATVSGIPSIRTTGMPTEIIGRKKGLRPGKTFL